MTAPIANFDITGAMQHGWRLFRTRTPIVYLGMLSWVQCSAGGSIQGDSEGFVAALQHANATDAAWAVWALLVAASFVALIELGLFFVRAFFTPGWNRWLAAATAGEDAPTQHMFSGADRLLAQAGWRVVRTVLMTVPTVLAAVPGGLLWLGMAKAGVPPGVTYAVAAVAMAVLMTGVYVVLSAHLVLGDALVALEHCGPIAAAKRSYAMTASIRKDAVLFVLAKLLLGVIALTLGLFTCCVGLLVTMPLWLVTVDAGAVRAVTTAFEPPTR